jgi:hypothetical protein
MEKHKWLIGVEVVGELGIKDFELFDYVIAGLKPYAPTRERLPTPRLRSERVNGVLHVDLVIDRSQKNGPTPSDEINNRYRWQNYKLPNNPKEIKKIYNSLLSALYKVEDVDAIRSAPKTESAFQGEDPKDVTNYIKKRRASGASDQAIAKELHDKKGLYKLPYLAIGRAFKEEDGINLSVAALKQRGARLCKLSHSFALTL